LKVNVRQFFLCTALLLPEYDLHLVGYGKNLIPVLLDYCTFGKMSDKPDCTVVCTDRSLFNDSPGCVFVYDGKISKFKLYSMSFCLCTWDVHVSAAASDHMPATEQKCLLLNSNCTHLAESWQCFCKYDIYTPYMGTVDGKKVVFTVVKKLFKFLTLHKSS
jgi:hypothetical protein